MEKLGARDPAEPSPGAGPVAGVAVAKTAAGPEGDEEVAISNKLFRCALVKRLLPFAYREELYHVLRLTGPLLLSRVLNFLLPFVITIFCGHIGNAELAGYALASAVINVTTTATGYGLALACDTLISQTFGSKNMMRVGVILQRSIMILLVFCLICWSLLINAHSLLLAMHQEEEVARIAHLYVMAFIPAVPAMLLHNLQVAYLQNQGIILPQMYTAAAANIVNLGVNYVLISLLNWGVIGSAIANSFAQVTICLLLFGYIRWKKLHQQTWAGWSSDCLQEWGSYMKLAIPSVMMVCFEWWIWEIGGFLAGLLGEKDLAAQHVLLEIGAITYMFPLGVHVATSVRVGNALGAGDTDRALLTCKVALVLSSLLAVVQGVVIASSKSVLGYIFTTDDAIVSTVSENLTLHTFIQFFDGILCVYSGILVGSGMQKFAALTNLLLYYCVALPVGITLIFVVKLGLLGWWVGLFIGVVFQTGILTVLIAKLDWPKVTQKAQRRAGRKIVVTPKRPVSTVLSDAMVPDFSDSLNTAQLEREEAPKPAGYLSVNTQDQELKAGHEAPGNSTSAGRAPTSKPGARLSVTQLILRRGLTVLASVLILAIGVAVHLAVPLPDPAVHSNVTLNWTGVSTPSAALNSTLSTI
ncbi:multidrug and toxin extrusion protein 1 [Genypterus blacodes]|uniref:multidrug and toxin extrusion protein 1 n=1 Tax=Genypterus blacodes TaxID=154954 RepID=UPI003F7721BC